MVAAQPKLTEAMFAPNDFMAVTPELIRALDGDAVTAVVLTRIKYRQNTTAADREGHRWFRASLDEITAETGLSQKQVRRALDRLVESGSLVKKQATEGSRDQTKAYRLVVEPLPLRATPFAPEGNSQLPVRADVPPTEEVRKDMLTHGVSESDEVTLDPTRPAPKTTPVALLDEEFATRWWSTYPRKVAKETARRAYRMARRKASLDDLLAGVEAYVRNKPDWADYAYPASWLNGGRWADEHETAPATSARTEPLPMPDVDPDDVTAWVAAMEARRG